MLWLLWNRVASRKTRSYWILEEAKQARGKPDAKSLGTDSKNTIHSFYATSSKYQGRERTIAWKNTSQKKTSAAKSLRYENLRDRSQEETERQQRCAPKQGMEPCPKTFSSSNKKDKATFFSPAEEWVPPGCGKQKSRRKESLWEISGASMHMVSKKGFNSAELETMRTSRSPTTVFHGQRRGANKRRSNSFSSKNWIYSWLFMLLEENTPQFFLPGSSARIMGKLTTGPAVKKPHLTKKWQENWLHKKSKPCAIRSLWFINEFPLQTPHNYFFIIFITGFCIWRQMIRPKNPVPERESRCINQQKTEKQE